MLQDDKQYSWATGTAPEINSIYKRVVAARPEFRDHVANFAEGGATADQLAFQAQGALARVPEPALVIIQTIDNDMRCDGSDPSHVSEFGQDLSDALAAVTEKSPDSRILIVSQAGRPATWAAAVGTTPQGVASAQGIGMCDFYDASGNLVDEHVRIVTSIIENYEAEQARVCATVQHCTTDNGAFIRYVDQPDAIAIDYGHLNITGLNRLAEIIWPTIASLLGVQ